MGIARISLSSKNLLTNLMRKLKCTRDNLKNRRLFPTPTLCVSRSSSVSSKAPKQEQRKPNPHLTNSDQENVFAAASVRSEKSSDVQESEVVVKKTINKVNVSGASSSSAAISSSSAVEQSSSSALQSSRDIRAGSVYASSRAGSVARAGSTYRASSVRAGSMSRATSTLRY